MSSHFLYLSPSADQGTDELLHMLESFRRSLLAENKTRGMVTAYRTPVLMLHAFIVESGNASPIFGPQREENLRQTFSPSKNPKGPLEREGPPKKPLFFPLLWPKA